MAVLPVRHEDLATCVSCGLCLNDCPTYRLLGEEADSPRGRVQLIRELVATDAPPAASLTLHLDRCLVCRACETACPSGVPFGRIMEGARELVHERGRRPGLAGRIGLWLVTKPELLALAALLGTLYVRSGLQRAIRASHLLPAALAAMESLVSAREGAPYAPREAERADAFVFAGCLMRASFGETDRATQRVLERMGRTVGSPPAQTCCGALHAHAGDGERARELARANVAAFGVGDRPIVVNAAGCGAHLKAYGDVLADDPAWAARARAFASRVLDATEAVERTGTRSAGRLRVVYQDACHLAHGQRIRRQPRDLLRAVPGVELVEIAEAERCCGSAGTYNLSQPELASELRLRKVAAILAARPDAVVSANPGCMLQIRSGLRAAGSGVPVVHLMRFLDDPAGSLRAG